MGVPGNANALLLRSAAAAGGYQVSRSLRFNSADSAYLNRTPASAGNRKTWTWSGWVKRSALGSNSRVLFGTGTAGNDGAAIRFNGSDQLEVYEYLSGSFYYNLVSTQVFRDPSSFGHLVVSVDTSQATSSNRVKIYWNGAQITTFGTATYPSLDYQGEINTAVAHGIGRGGSYNDLYFNGYLADIHFIDGQALTPSSFTETDATTGQLIPKAYTGSFGTNGVWLKFSDNSAATATTLGKDYSGNGNNWTPNNLSVTAGAGNDSLVDTPTSYGTDTGAGGEVRGNYATLNPLGTAGAIPTNGNLSVSSSSTVGNRISTFFLTSGKWYWEGSGTGYVGAIVGRGGEGFTGSISATGSKAIGWWPVDGVAYWDGGNSGTGTTYSSTDVIGIALDMDAGTVKFYKNNTLIHNLTFGSGTVPNFSTGVFPGYNVGASTTSVDINFGQRPFAYTAPSGFKALCDTNLPAPVVAKPNTVMDVVLYSGTGSNQTITGLNFNPDFVWLKRRSSAQAHYLYDVIRGTSSVLYSDGPDAEQSISTGLTAFNSNGFSLGSLSGVNASSTTNVAWTWDAGTSTVTNTQGSITTSLRASASSGFSVISYTGTGSAGASIGHGLGVAPAFALFKNRSTSSDWQVYHVSLGNAQSILLQSTAAAGSSSAFNSTSPTSTVITLGAGTSLNSNGSSHICYAWAPVAGYNSISSYVGNGSSDGVFVYTGHRTRWLMIKRTDASDSWQIMDAARSDYNVADDQLYADLSNAEGSTGSRAIDFLSNGFKVRGDNSGINANGGTYVYVSFAESPFQYARAR